MVQWFNFEGIKVVPTLLFNRHLLKPTLSTSTINTVNWDKVKQDLQVSFVVFDKDNTLTKPYSLKIEETVKESFEQAKLVFGKTNIAILSNSAGTQDDYNFEQRNAVENSFGVKVITHKYKKPSKKCMEEVLEWRAPASKILVVGDRVLTDVVFANLNGAKSLYCSEILSGENDSLIASYIRNIEHKLF